MGGIPSYIARHPGPGAIVEGLPGGLDGEVDVGLVALGDVGDDLAGARVPGLERLTCGEEYNGQLYFLFHSRKFRCFCFHRLEHGKPNCLNPCS